MTNKPAPVCKAFLICKRIDGNQLTLIGQENWHGAHSFPSAQPLAYFAKLRCMRGKCEVQVQLQNESGDVVWRSASLESPPMQSPLQTLELKLPIVPVFPSPGDFSLVLVVNGEELDREPFGARLLGPTATT